MTNLTLSGMAGGEPFSILESITLPQGDTTLFAVARYWGAQKIQSLPTMIQHMGKQQE